jgi:hypothetical protein
MGKDTKPPALTPAQPGRPNDIDHGGAVKPGTPRPELRPGDAGAPVAPGRRG